MSVNGDAARRDIWAGRIEHCLASGMAVGEWCSLNKVSRSSLYRWLAVFRDEDPGRFAGKNSETSGWVKAAREGIAAVCVSSSSCRQMGLRWKSWTVSG